MDAVDHFSERIGLTIVFIHHMRSMLRCNKRGEHCFFQRHFSFPMNAGMNEIRSHGIEKFRLKMQFSHILWIFSPTKHLLGSLTCEDEDILVDSKTTASPNRSAEVALLHSTDGTAKSPRAM